MRSLALISMLTLATAAVAFIPTADALTEVCTIGTSGCEGFVCVERDGHEGWSDAECVSKTDLDRCRFQSDCCDGVSFWCPDRE